MATAMLVFGHIPDFWEEVGDIAATIFGEIDEGY
jgi:hypothetical protein